MIGIIFIFLITLAIFSSKKEKNEKDTEQSQKGKKGEQEFSEKNIISYTSKKESYYNILGVSENASPEEIKKAYREKAMRYHPDHNSNKEKAEIEFRRIKEAYDILKDEKKRKEYDFLNARIYEDRNIFKTKNDNYVYREYFREKLIREVFYDENRLNCIEKKYYMTGELYSETPYKNGQIHGIWKVFYKNGKIKREQTYVEGVSNGCCRNYYKNGNIQDEFFKKNGKLEGTVKCFYENGILKVESQYKNDYIEGYTKKYYKTGELKTDGYFRHGKENGVVKEYYRNGAIKIETIYVDGKIGETNKNYYENGKIKSISTYKEGIVQNCMNYDRKENLKSIEHYAKGTLTKTEYFKDGKLVSSEENKSLININLNKFYELIDLMKSTRVYTEEELKELWELDKIREQKIIEKAFNENITYGQASDEYNFLNQSYEDFQVYLKSINDNFSVNVEIIRYGFENYIKRGDAPFPYYAWRIAVILSKNRLYVEEKEFLHEWCRHFQRLENCGARYRDLVARARKKRAI